MAERGRVLITGAGMVGCHASALLLADGWRVTLLDRRLNRPYLHDVIGDPPALTLVEADIVDRSSVAAAAGDQSLDAAVHTAALVSAGAQTDFESTMAVNVLGTTNVASVAHERSATRFVFLSTTGVYADEQEAPITERAPLRQDFELFYAASKLACEHLLSSLAAVSPMKVVLLRPAVMLGHGPHQGGGVGSAALDEVLVSAIRTGRADFPVDRLSTTEWVSVHDVARAVERACVLDLPGQVHRYNIGSGAVTSTEELMEMVLECVPGAALRTTGSARAATLPVRRFAMDTSAAQRDLQVEPTPLLLGIRQVVTQIRASGSDTEG